MDRILKDRLTAWLENAEFNKANTENESRYAYYQGCISTLKDVLELIDEAEGGLI